MNCLECDQHLYPRRCSVPNRYRHGGRGLCQPCYVAKHRAGELDQFVRRTRPSIETVEDVEFLYSIGLTRLQAAQRLGITSDAIYRAQRRAQAHAGNRPA